AFGSLIYTPAERAADGGWLSRRQLAARGDRVILFHNRNEDKDNPFSTENDGRFGVPVPHTDPNGHLWHFVARRGAEDPLAVSIAFRALGDSNPFPELGHLGVHSQLTVNGLADNNFQGTGPEDANSFFAMTSDGLNHFPVFLTRRETPEDVARAVQA